MLLRAPLPHGFGSKVKFSGPDERPALRLDMTEMPARWKPLRPSSFSTNKGHFIVVRICRDTLICAIRGTVYQKLPPPRMAFCALFYTYLRTAAAHNAREIAAREAAGRRARAVGNSFNAERQRSREGSGDIWPCRSGDA